VSIVGAGAPAGAAAVGVKPLTLRSASAESPDAAAALDFYKTFPKARRRRGAAAWRAGRRGKPPCAAPYILVFSPP
jgi:hypothetical protein